MSASEPVVLLLIILVGGLSAMLVWSLRRQRAVPSVPVATVPPPLLSVAPEQPAGDGRSELDSCALDLVEDAVIYLDGRRRVLYLNRSARSLTDAEEGQPLIEALRDHDIENLLRRSIAQGEEQMATVELTRPGRVVEAMVHPVPEVGIVMALRDRTEVLHLQKVRRELIANISHELRTPLTTQQFLVETLIEGAVDDPEARDDFLLKLKEQVDHLSAIVQQSLYLASLESGQVTATIQAVPVQALVRRSVNQLLPRAQQAGVEVSVELSHELPLVNADPEQIRRVMTNLLDNAIKWTPPGGRITVRATRDADHAASDVRAGPRTCPVCFEVRDTGPGIPTEQLSRLFERFYKGDEARSGGGTGLGLSIAKHAVQLHGGHIWAESTEGEGASFYFTLPVANPEA